MPYLLEQLATSLIELYPLYTIKFIPDSDMRFPYS